MMFRLLLRRLFRFVLRLPGLGFLRRLAVRVPFSRFHGIASHLFWGEEIVEWRGVRVAVNPGEVQGYYPYFLGDYSATEIDTCIAHCRAARTFADVGANIGLFALAVARACPQLTVFAFEPDRHIAGRFRANLARNPDLGSRVHLIEAALSDMDGTMSFLSVHDSTNTGVGRLSKLGGDGQSCLVQGLTLPSFCRQYATDLDVMKIDIEGAELKVLQGMRGMTPFPRALLVETHGFYLPTDDARTFNRNVVALLEAEQYALFRLVENEWQTLRDATELGVRGHLLAVRGI